MPQLKLTLVAAAIAASLSPAFVIAQTAEEVAADGTEVIEVQGVRTRLEQAGALADTITKTELIGEITIANKNAVNLTEAIDTSPGVKVSAECSMCGVKRIMLNGMKGEQTTILVDGLPVHTMISGFYAVDAIPTTGIEAIEVARGAGASLTAPEAIGGTINVITKEPTESGAEFDISAGENGYRKLGFAGYGVSEDGRTRATLIGQYDDRDAFDGDNNLVNESPSMENRILTARISHDIGDFDNLVLRVSNVESDVFGGPMLGNTFNGKHIDSLGGVLADFASGEADELFVDGDVRNDFAANAWETTEWIKTTRDEVSLSWLHEFNDKLNLTTAVSYADHVQDSFYEGFDYYADDEMLFLSARFNYILNDDHLLTFGVDNRSEEMRSTSLAGDANLTDGDPDTTYVSDSFDYDVIGLYLQDTWQVSDALEISLALRYDQIEADFVDPSKPGVEIDEDILSPRLDMRYMHTDNLTSRFSAGHGYRAPLSFFESDHGILDAGAGFDIQVDELERSNSANYSLAWEDDKLTAAASIAWTEVENLAGLDENEAGVPVLIQLDEDASVVAADIAVGYAFTDDLTVNFTAEVYNYDDAFKSSYAIAPTEERITLAADYDIAKWELYADVVWYGSRDLADYGYDGLYNTLEDAANGVNAKSTDASSYFIVNMKASYELNKNFSVYVGASNLFDYNQAADEESPLFFDDAGEFDVGYIYGPLRGREAYAGLKVTF